MFFMYFPLEAQNLVLNPSFEDTISCSQWPPPNFSCSGPCMTPPWFQPTFGSPDYFNAYYSTNCGGGGGNYPNYYDNVTGFQMPNSGYGMEGFAAYFVDVSQPGIREMLEGRLSAPLLSGHEYCISYYISLANNSDHSIWSIVIYFSTDSILEPDSIIGKSPQVINTQGNYLADTLNWTHITSSFVANGGEEYFLIGNFRSNNNTDTIHVVPEDTVIGFQNLAYYYVDDFNIIDCTVGIEEQIESQQLNISPNPANDVIIFSLEQNGSTNLSYQIIDLSGRIVMSGNIENIKTNYELPVQNLSEGMYYLLIRSSQNTLSMGKFIKI